MVTLVHAYCHGCHVFVHHVCLYVLYYIIARYVCV